MTSTRAARAAGRTDATTAAANSTIADSDHRQRARHRHVLEIAARQPRQQNPQAAPATTPAAAITAPSAITPRRRCRGCDPIASRMPNSRVRPLTENASTPATPTTAIDSATAAKHAEHQCVQTIRREHFRADIFKRRRMLHGLIGGHAANDVRDRRDQRIRIRSVWTNRRPPTWTLLQMAVDGDRLGPGTTFSSSISAVTPMMRRGCGADVDELHHRIGPIDMMIDGILIGEHALRQALADDHDRSSLPLADRASLKSRPATIGTPSAAKNPGEMTRNCARGSSSPAAWTWPSAENSQPSRSCPRRAREPQSRPRRLLTPGSSSMRRIVSL